MTTEQLKNLRDAIDAYLAGKPLQVMTNIGNWKDCVDSESGVDPFDSWMRGGVLLRPKPQPKTRPWSKPEDVPGGVIWVRTLDRTNSKASLEAMLVAISPVCLTFFTNDVQQCPWEKIGTLEYSTDRKTWLPCVVVDEGEK